MSRTAVALVGLLVLGGCQGSGTPPLDMEIVTTQENDGLQQASKVQMIEGFERQKEELGCP
jgi:ABC-type glycerol-3-phosphate transport system substrate-binding protein